MFNSVRLLDILSIIDQLQNTTFPIVRAVDSAQGKSRITCIARRLSTKLFNALDTVCDYFYCHEEVSSAHPTVALFLTHMREVYGLHLIHERYLDSDVADELARDINNALYAFLREFKSKAHRKRLNDLKRVESRNQRSIATYVNSLFDQHAKLLVLRLDIGYRKAYYDQLTLDLVTNDRNSYLRRIQNKYPALVGYIWKLEYGVDRRFHTHITCFFNGAIHQRDISLGIALGELWEDMSDNNGSYFNCQVRREDYREWGTDGIGMVHYSDTTKRINLINALGYLTKLDTQVLAVLPAGRRTFGRMERPSRQPRLGRPRLLFCRSD
ncbi:inovirus Gp2 family protein [Aeromonas caviae]|uniref:Inovirus Gp2 family protein n=1 Tax=Aeromonas caviae TaxID=648 RepID=A0AA42UD29_AERCA|nr:inovirus-type Gp2 protein [Aeromonas caviae]MDH1505255.1 inovirus Gp2 family protein [Aeromonas caviae]MDH1803409.1 inovirus Gp2 family protein [Aeromonas caviae]